MQKVFGDSDGNGQKDGRFSDGNVPNTNWNDDKFYLDNGYQPDKANPNLRARVEVSRTRGALCSFLRIDNPAVCFFRYDHQLFREPKIGLFICDDQLPFSPYQMFQHLYLYSQ
ncbi:MAG: hypothetical protein COV91_05770 [Candidatus Taylorbacteria bacterium CG11_big_fil_rev_8_21_14_0_20_46_11]|uniref:Uncharacterized protein n=1 Tax=Candidatus Taylorbacteria bacterium CG11_big_fil_rev_8_21_14_0_20_46_11 TaxID=1975025 RepID=A0A2H0KBZ2_9BACT|nr:MAG: hypothetical protein COV91_05770 [Candidatus Taylorbacteria bacterium CG11_big_fil_rev_8_21_14_0_20_46_11]